MPSLKDQQHQHAYSNSKSKGRGRLQVSLGNVKSLHGNVCRLCPQILIYSTRMVVWSVRDVFGFCHFFGNTFICSSFNRRLICLIEFLNVCCCRSCSCCSCGCPFPLTSTSLVPCCVQGNLNECFLFRSSAAGMFDMRHPAVAATTATFARLSASVRPFIASPRFVPSSTACCQTVCLSMSIPKLSPACLEYHFYMPFLITVSIDISMYVCVCV